MTDYSVAVDVATRFLRMLGVPRRLDLREVAHDVAVIVLTCSSPPSPERFCAFVRSVARHHRARLLRPRSHYRVVLPLDFEPRWVDHVAESIDASALIERDASGLLRRYYIEGRSIAEIAEIDGLGFDVVKTRLARARNRVRDWTVSTDRSRRSGACS